MRCYICNNEGANTIGFHPACFMQSINEKVPPSSRTVFSGSGVRHEETGGPRSEEDWVKYKTATEARRLQEEAEIKAREEAARKAEADYEQRHRAYERQYGWWAGWNQSRTQSEQQRSQPNTETATVSVQIDAKRLKQLLMLCHPDKHANSERATDVTRWLIGIKERLK